MEQVYSMIKLFGERYVFCDQEQALFDATENRDDLVNSFAAIMDYINMKSSKKVIDNVLESE